MRSNKLDSSALDVTSSALDLLLSALDVRRSALFAVLARSSSLGAHLAPPRLLPMALPPGVFREGLARMGGEAGPAGAGSISGRGIALGGFGPPRAISIIRDETFLGNGDPMLRRKRVDRLVELAGNVVTVIDRRDGWPSLVRIHLPVGDVLAAVHLGPIGLTHRKRDAVERRFQNPDKNRPMSAPEGYMPLLLGIWEEGLNPVLVGMEADTRVGKATRQSLFAPLWLLEQASAAGWAQHYNTAGELIIGFHPALLSAYIEARRSGLHIEPEQVADISEASGLVAPPEETAAERARRGVSTLVRRARFGRQVVEAYGGRCALCGLNFGLVEGAHIYPVQAPSSSDAIWNGLALCGNHHAAFDRHLLWIEPSSRSVKLHPGVLSSAREDEITRHFVQMTLPQLRSPESRGDLPREEMFHKRYKFFEMKYDWASTR